MDMEEDKEDKRRTMRTLRRTATRTEWGQGGQRGGREVYINTATTSSSQSTYLTKLWWRPLRENNRRP